MYIEQIGEDEYTRLINRGVKEVRIEDEYRYDKYIYHLVNGKSEAVLMLCKYCYGLMPVIKQCGSRIFIGSGRSIDIIEQSTLHQCCHHDFYSPLYDMLIESERVIAVMEIEIIVFDSLGNIVTIHRIDDIIVDYSILDSKIIVSTFEGYSFEITI